VKWRGILIALAVCTACGTPDPPPDAKSAATSNSDWAFADLLRRADAVTPKNAPDTLAAVPPEDEPPVKVVVVQFNRPGPAPYYGPYYGSPATSYSYSPSSYSPSSYSRALPSRPQKSDMEMMMDRAERAFGYRVSSLAYRKSSLAGMRAQKSFGCTGTMPTRPINAASGVVLPEDRAGSTTCRMMIAQLEYEERSFRQSVDGIEIEASRMGIYPGVIRDLYARRGFDPY
jgi:hypothetical protein